MRLDRGVTHRRGWMLLVTWLSAVAGCSAADAPGPGASASDERGDAAEAAEQDSDVLGPASEAGTPSPMPPPRGSLDAGVSAPDAGEPLDYSFGEPHLDVTVSPGSDWMLEVAADSLTRRILGLRFRVEPKGGSWDGDTFEIWPEDGNDVSDARLYHAARMLVPDPWVVEVRPVLRGPQFSVPAADEGTLPSDAPDWYLGPKGINAYEAWQMFEPLDRKPGEGVIVGLPDTGYLDHPELFHEDGTTRLRLDLQRNFADSSTPHDAHDFCETSCGFTVNKTIKLAYVGHGSTTASLIISPPGRQSKTVGHLHTEGAAQFAQVIPIRVAASVLMTPAAMGRLARAIEYAADHGAKVISISMGGVTLGDEELRDAIRGATARGAIVLAAAGNTPYNNSTPFLKGVSKPASYDETIAVAGSNVYERPWRDSSRGPEVDVCAPAEDVRRARAGWYNQTEHVNDTDRGEGTSMATALAASVAALWISYHGFDALVEHYGDPAKIVRAFRKIITTTGKRTPSGWDTERYGAGILDAARVLRAPLPDVD